MTYHRRPSPRLSISGRQETVRIVRLRSAAATPLLLETSWIPRVALSRSGARGTGAANRSTRSWSFATGIVPRAARQTIEATTASAFESELLDMAEDAPMLDCKA